MKLTKGINLGGFLSQCEYKEEHYKEFITEDDIKKIAAAGFDHVRLPVDYNIFENEDGSENTAWIEYVTKTVEWAEHAGLSIILDLHKAPGYDFNDAGDSEKNNLFTRDDLKDRFLNLWTKIAEKYGKYPHVAFELLNEVVEKENAELWNDLISRSVQAIRKVNKDTLIIYGGIQWNSVKTLKLLEKPVDKNVLFTFHFYEPLIFTHQKAYWVKGMDPDEDIFYPEAMSYYIEKSERLGFQGEVAREAASKTMSAEFIEEMIREAIVAAEAAGVGLYCGEFGVIDRAPIEDTYRWFVDVNEVFRKYNIGYALWTYKKMDFGLIDDHYAPIYDKLIKMWME